MLKKISDIELSEGFDFAKNRGIQSYRLQRDWVQEQREK